MFVEENMATIRRAPLNISPNVENRPVQSEASMPPGHASAASTAQTGRKAAAATQNPSRTDTSEPKRTSRRRRETTSEVVQEVVRETMTEVTQEAVERIGREAKEAAKASQEAVKQMLIEENLARQKEAEQRYARAFPDWDLLPPQLLVRRVTRK